MSFPISTETLSRFDINLDLEIAQGGHSYQICGEAKHYKLQVSSWSSFLSLLNFLRKSHIGWLEIWKVRGALKASGRKLCIIVKGDRRFSIGA